MDLTDLAAPIFTDDGRLRLGDIELGVGERHEEIVLRAMVTLPWRVAVLERIRGGLWLIGEDGLQLGIMPHLELDEGEDIAPAFLDRLMTGDTDLPGEYVLARGEPDYHEVARALPRLVDYGFVGDPGVAERVMIQPDGSIEGLLGPLTDLSAEALRARAAWGTLDAKLPLPVLYVWLGEDHFAQQLVVPTLNAEGQLRVLVRRGAWDREGETIEYLAPGSPEPADASEFYHALLRALMAALEYRMQMASVISGDQELVNLALSSLWLADLTARGCRPRYGIGVYDQERHHGFPPATLYLVHCLLDWGHFERARDLLDCYVDAYVNEDGTFAYYGPALAEYGQMLSLTAHFASTTGDLRWWSVRQVALRPVWRRLLELRRASMADPEAPETARGLVPGLPEADYHGDEAQWRQYYFSGNAWAVRGLEDVAGMLALCNQEPEAEGVLREALAWREDLLRAVAMARVPTERGVFVGPGPTQLQPFEHMTQDRHASYVNYRYWGEMISAAVLDERTMREVLEYRRSHGGELLGMTRFEDRLDDWPVLNYARALLELGEVDRYLLLMYAHLAHHQSLGWLTSYEQVSIRPDESGLRRQIAGQVTPCQVVVPQMLRWALAYELRDQSRLLVAPCLPWHWVAESPLAAAGLPTSWGPLGFAIHSGKGRVNLSLSLPEDFDATARVRVPTPGGAPLKSVKVNGRSRKRFDAERRFVDVSTGSAEVEIEARF